jgi:hypothetical protein
MESGRKVILCLWGHSHSSKLIRHPFKIKQSFGHGHSTLGIASALAWSVPLLARPLDSCKVGKEKYPSRKEVFP